MVVGLAESPPRPFEQAIGKRQPEHREEQPHEDIREHRPHFILRGRFCQGFELNHALQRPGKALQSEYERRPCPHFRHRCRPPPQKPAYDQTPSHDSKVRGLIPEDPKSNGGHETSEGKIQ